MDSRTKALIATLHPKAQEWARAHIEAIEASGKLPKGYSVRIVSGNRTWKEQDALYAKGRTAPGDRVTNARGGQSNHNFGIAWDIGIFDPRGRYLGESPLYAELGPIGEELGLEWGGRWRSPRDYPHYQVRVNRSVSQLRALFLRGEEAPVPAYKGSAAEPLGDTVLVVDGSEKTDIPAFLEGGRVFIGVRKFVDRFGGEVLRAEADGFEVELGKERVSMPGFIRDGVGFAKFVDLNRVLGWGYAYEANVLTIRSEEK